CVIIRDSLVTGRPRLGTKRHAHSNGHTICRPVARVKGGIWSFNGNRKDDTVNILGMMLRDGAFHNLKEGPSALEIYFDSWSLGNHANRSGHNRGCQYGLWCNLSYK